MRKLVAACKRTNQKRGIGEGVKNFFPDLVYNPRFADKIKQNQIIIKSIVIKKLLDEVTFSNKAAKFRGAVLVSF